VAGREEKKRQYRKCKCFTAEDTEESRSLRRREARVQEGKRREEKRREEKRRTDPPFAQGAKGRAPFVVSVGMSFLRGDKPRGSKRDPSLRSG
jgi:hypothetical protein